MERYELNVTDDYGTEAKLVVTQGQAELTDDLLAGIVQDLASALPKRVGWLTPPEIEAQITDLVMHSPSVFERLRKRTGR